MSLTARDKEGFAAFLLRMRGQGLADKRLLAAIEATPRRAFVPEEFQESAFSSRMVPTDCGEAIEGLDLQARVLASLDITANCRVLEIGTGSGFTAAVMARMASRVTTVDRFRTLTEKARHRFRTLGLDNIIAHTGNAERALDGEGPFDRIVVWAAFPALPRQYTDLLASGGVMIAPIGGPEEAQVLARLVKVGSRFERSDIGHVRLQPLADSLPQAL